MYMPISIFGLMSTYSIVQGLIKSAVSGYKLYGVAIESSSTLKQCIPHWITGWMSDLTAMLSGHFILKIPSIISGFGCCCVSAHEDFHTS